MNLRRTYLWRKLRERRILASHRRVAGICEELIASYRANPVNFEVKAKKTFPNERIIWQYWAQGYEGVPPTVRECLESVEKHAGDFTIVRLSDDNLSEYIELPEFVSARRNTYSTAHFSDLLRLALLKAYGGIWMDATVLLSGPIPESYLQGDFFVFRRDPNERDVAYWRDTYAYYFGWAKGFRVNMLNSFIYSAKNGKTISELCDLMFLWWRDNEGLPDYFFFQILFDAYAPRDRFPLVSDTLPHYLQQSLNDPGFNLMPRDEILSTFPIHKLTYKKEG